MAFFKRRWFMWDFARQRRFDRKEFLMVVEKLSQLGYNGVGLYLEGAFELKCLGGGIMRKGVMTHEDAKWAKEKCEELGIFLFPMTNVVGHMEHFFRQERLKHLGAKLRQGCLDIKFELPEAEEFVFKIINEYLEAFDTDYIHIGGDEATLNDQNRPVYAKFLSGICERLLANGKKPAIWDDLLWKHKELVTYFNRNIDIFDWYYYGHRPESIEYFKTEGFKNVIACPCENSWLGFINHQEVDYRKSRESQIPVSPDEVEAFLADEAEKGDPENLQGLLTLWESTMGRDLWGQWSAIARAGLFMQGKFKAKSRDDSALEMAVFGRITPYTEIMHIIQDEIHSQFPHIISLRAFRHALFLRNFYLESAIDAISTGKDYYPLVEDSIVKVEKLLDTWTTENEFEACCKADLVSVAALMRAAFALNSAFSSCTKLYTEAAKIQFENPEKAKILLSEFADGLDNAAAVNREYKSVLSEFIAITAHTDTDFIKLDTTYEYTKEVANTVRSLTSEQTIKEIALPTINFILDWAVDRAIIER